MLLYGWHRRKGQLQTSLVSRNLSRSGQKLVVLPLAAYTERSLPYSSSATCTIPVVPPTWSGIEPGGFADSGGRHPAGDLWENLEAPPAVRRA